VPPTLPRYSVRHNINESPHVVVLGAGATRATFPAGDAHGRISPLMKDFVDVLGLAPVLDAAGIQYQDRNFEDIYEETAATRGGSTVLQRVKDHVYEYFDQMEMPREVTIYDRIILSLRRKDLIATFNWDPFLVQAYIRNRHLGELPPLAFLHGSVAVVGCSQCRVTDFKPSSCSKCGRGMVEVPLLYPISQKGYHQGAPFISNEWKRLERTLDEAYFLTIFGYSAPKSDIEARTLMRRAWERNRTRVLAQIEFINTVPREQLEGDWKEFIVGEHCGFCENFQQSWLTMYPRRSCEALAWATLQCDPWEEDPFPDSTDLHDLQRWVMPLITQEREYAATGRPFTRLPLQR